MVRVAAVSVIDPDHHQPPAGRRPPDHLIRLAIAKFYLDPTGVAKCLINFHNRDVPFGMVRAEVLAIGSVPGRSVDRPPILYIQIGWTKRVAIWTISELHFQFKLEL